jgi:hypothetical protein
MARSCGCCCPVRSGLTLTKPPRAGWTAGHGGKRWSAADQLWGAGHWRGIAPVAMPVHPPSRQYAWPAPARLWRAPAPNAPSDAGVPGCRAIPRGTASTIALHLCPVPPRPWRRATRAGSTIGASITPWCAISTTSCRVPWRSGMSNGGWRSSKGHFAMGRYLSLLAAGELLHC